MRTLSLALLLSAGSLTACSGGNDLEICDDNIDNDGDGLLDAADDDCPNPEVCDSGADDDGDGAIDCADPDCLTATPCIAEICDDEIDNNGDGLTDCADTVGCPTTAGEVCGPWEQWALEGTGTFANSAYTGGFQMTDKVTNNPNGVYNIGDSLCTADYTHNSTGVATNTECPSCEFSFAFPDMAQNTAHTGPECDQWYSYTDPNAASPILYVGEWGTPINWGLTTAYQYAGGTYTVAMYHYDGTGGQAAAGWYPYAAATYDSADGATTWFTLIGADGSEYPY